MDVFDRVLTGVDGTDFGFEALHQTLALSPPAGTVYALTALDTAFAVHASFNMSDVAAQLEGEAGRARATAAEIMGGRLNCTTKVVRGDAKSVLRQACNEYDATSPGARRSEQQPVPRDDGR